MVKQVRAAVTYELILDGAAQVFAEFGYERAKLNDIVDRTGLTRGALYFHFQSKEDLAKAVIERQHRLSIGAVESIAGTAAPALAQIVMLCHEMGRQIVDDVAVAAGIRLTLEQSASVGPAAPYEGWISACRTLAVQAIAEGDLLGTVDPDALGRFVIAAFTGIQLMSNVRSRREDLEVRIDEMWGLLLPALVRPDSSTPLNEIRASRWSAND